MYTARVEHKSERIILKGVRVTSDREMYRKKKGFGGYQYRKEKVKDAT